MNAKQHIAGLVAQALRTAFPQAQDLPASDAIEGFLEVPPERTMGDFAFPCFRLSRTLRMGPPQIAQKLLEALGEDEWTRAQTAGGYLNFFMNQAKYAASLLAQIGPEYGNSTIGAGKTICLDYSSINIAKRFHIGHLSTTMIGHSLKRIYESLGYRAIGINHLGDWGTQFGKMICAYLRWGDK